MSLRRFVFPVVFIVSSICCLVGFSIEGQQGKDKSSDTQTSDSTLDTGLPQFFDERMEDQLKRNHIPGATVVVVKDGAILFAKGYGFADLENEIPVDREKSLFRIASVTKLFTWTAIMQLVEDGQLDLHTDVNQYLDDFQLPGNNFPPITVDHLMSHTAGFEDRGLIGSLARTSNDVVPLARYLDEQMPRRVRPPGRISAYSNYGGALAGHIVSRASEMPYEEFVEKRIFVPLGMQNALVTQNPSIHQIKQLAKGYVFQDDVYRPVPYAIVIPTPEGGISASATSIAKFMAAHLEDGRNESGRILLKETVQQMHRQSFTHHPDLPGWANGFEEDNVNGHRLLQHGGSLGQFVSLLVLVPDQRLGLFVSFNSLGGSRASRELKTGFFDTFLPATTQPETAGPADSPNAGDVAGVYAPCRSAETTIAKLGKLVQAVRLSQLKDGGFEFLGRHWVCQDADLLQRTDGEQKLAVGRNEAGQGEFLFLGINAWKRLRWFESPRFHLTLIGGCLLAFLSAVVVWPVSYFISRRRRDVAETGDGRSRHARLAAFTCAFLNILFILLLAKTMSGDTSELEFGVPWALRILLLLPFLSAGLALVIVLFSIASWSRSYWKFWARVHYAVVASACVGFVWFLNYWNLIGWRF